MLDDEGDDKMSSIAGKYRIITLDVGGTSIKWAVVNPEKKKPEERVSFVKIHQDVPARRFIEVVAGIVEVGCSEIKSQGSLLYGIGICMPGPFDYERGISYMLHKFKSLYGINLKEKLRKVPALPRRVKLKFDGDMMAFLRGEWWLGEARGTKKAMGITVGTGLGSAFLIDGVTTRRGKGIPFKGELWNKKFRGSMAEEWVGRRWIISRYEELKARHELDGAEIAERALRGEPEAQQVFHELGENLGEILLPTIDSFRPEVIVFGGQISRSYELFKQSLEKTVRRARAKPRLARSRLLERAPLYGVSYLLWKANKDNRR